MKFKISISIIKKDLGLSKKELCEIINSVHSDDYNYSLLSFQTENIHILGIVSNDYFEKYEFNQNTIKEEILKTLPNISDTRSTIHSFNLEDRTLVNIYKFNPQSSRIDINERRTENSEESIPF